MSIKKNRSTLTVWDRHNMVARAKLPSSRHKLALVVLQSYAGEDGICWPSMQTIADAMCASKRTAQTAIHELEKMGHVSFEGERPGLPSRRYRIHYQTLPQMETAAERRARKRRESDTGAKSAPAGAAPVGPQNLQASGAKSAPGTCQGMAQENKPKAQGAVRELRQSLAGLGTFDDAKAAHDAVEQALRLAGWTTEREVRVDERGDGRPGYVDLVATKGEDVVGIEIDAHCVRQKSITKLQQVDGVTCRLVVLRAVSEGTICTSEFLDGVVVLDPSCEQPPEPCDGDEIVAAAILAAYPATPSARPDKDRGAVLEAIGRERFKLDGMSPQEILQATQAMAADAKRNGTRVRAPHRWFADRAYAVYRQAQAPDSGEERQREREQQQAEQHNLLRLVAKLSAMDDDRLEALRAAAVAKVDHEAVAAQMQRMTIRNDKGEVRAMLAPFLWDQLPEGARA